MGRDMEDMNRLLTVRIGKTTLSKPCLESSQMRRLPWLHRLQGYKAV